MPGFLLDTNVLAEFSKRDPAAPAIAFLANRNRYWTSTIVRYELEHGVNCLPQGHRRDVLKIQTDFLMDLFKNRILPFGEKEASTASRLMALAEYSGRTPELADILIAGTAVANNLTLVTRNVKDFENLGIDLVNPWDAG